MRATQSSAKLGVILGVSEGGDNDADRDDINENIEIVLQTERSDQPNSGRKDQEDQPIVINSKISTQDNPASFQQSAQDSKNIAKEADSESK